MEKLADDQKRLEKIIEEIGEDNLCKYCKYERDCPGQVTGGPNGPIYAPCVDNDLDAWFDIELYLGEDGKDLE